MPDEGAQQDMYITSHQAPGDKASHTPNRWVFNELVQPVFT